MKLPILSGKEVISFLEHKGFSITRQKGSHVVLVKKHPLQETKNSSAHT